MDDLTAFVSWPSAPLTNRLVLDALRSLSLVPKIVSDLPSNPPSRFLQWSTYDALEHDLTFSHHSDSKVLSSSYVIRKALIRKHYLSRCIHNYLVKHPDSTLKRGVPRTWELELSFADELDELWSDDLYDLAEEIEKNDPHKWWILKPGMADRGMGLRLFHSREDLEAIFQEFEEEDIDDENGERDSNGPDTAVATSQLRHFVIQVRWNACSSVGGSYTLSGISGKAAATRPGGGAARGRIEADCQSTPWSQSQHVTTSGFTCYSSAV